MIWLRQRESERSGRERKKERNHAVSLFICVNRTFNSVLLLLPRYLFFWYRYHGTSYIYFINNQHPTTRPDPRTRPCDRNRRRRHRTPTSFWFLRRDFRGITMALISSGLRSFNMSPSAGQGCMFPSGTFGDKSCETTVHINILNRRCSSDRSRKSLSNPYTPHSKNSRSPCPLNTLCIILTTPGIFRILKRVPPDQSHV